MAIDEWLWNSMESPTLRVYRWEGNWGSLGYFNKLSQAQQSLPDLQWVRRYSGGGIVDHRDDWTYTLIIPNATDAAKAKGAKIYCAIHAALADALNKEGISCQLSGGEGVTGSMVCFQNPVCHDLINDSGQKIAGAGQRRGKRGMLHQGSLAIAANPNISDPRAENFADTLSPHVETVELNPPREVIEQLINSRYGRLEWTEKKP